MPEMDGLELLRRLQKDYPDLPVVMLPATESIQLAVQAIKAGAYDYLAKPFNYHQIQIVAEKALGQRRLRQENTQLRSELQKTYRFENLIVRCEAMQEVFRKIEKAAEAEANVLILGENGTGKELIARAIHYNGPRRRKPFIAVDCAAIPETLMESELFGHERGAFTGAHQQRKGKFELAHGGTLFLDEIAEMTIEGQAKLLRALQERQFTRLGGERTLQVDIRVISATNRPLEEAIRTGAFREDLYYRLNVIPIPVPPLRERMSDVPLLVECFLRKLSPENRRIRMTPEALHLLTNAEWPGNIRQLENVIHSAVALCEGDDIHPEDLGSEFHAPDSGTAGGPPPPSPPDSITLDERLKAYEKQLVQQALEDSGGVEKRAAELLGVSPRTVWYLVKKHRLKKNRRG
jgi:DNA-binding NtrC family response regulator